MQKAKSSMSIMSFSVKGMGILSDAVRPSLSYNFNPEQLDHIYTYTQIINNLLKDDKELELVHVLNKLIPMTLLDGLADGVILCKLLLFIDQDCMDSRAIEIGDDLE